MAITQLPTEDSLPAEGIHNKVILVYGERKIGKTTFASQTDNPLFIATEPGQSHLRIRKVEVSSWSDFISVCNLIAEGKHDRKTIVIDTIDNLYKFCRDYILDKHNMKHESDEAFGKGYDLVNGAFFRVLNKLSLLPYGLVMISHSQDKEVKTRTGKQHKIAPTLPNSAYKVVGGMADYILYAGVEEVKDDEGIIIGFRHVLHTKPTTIYEAGMRLEPGKPELPEILPLNYHAFSKALRYEPLSPEDWNAPGAQVSSTVAAESKSESKSAGSPATKPGGTK